jgi:hypothetical protein
VGIENFIGRAEQLAARFGERFRPTAGLRARAAVHTRYYPMVGVS